jgi:hypothetical protein
MKNKAKKQKRAVSLLAMGLLLLVGVLFPSSSAAVDGGSNVGEERITLSPAVLQPEFLNGQKGTGVLTVLNDGDKEYTFLVYARPFSVDGEEYGADYTEVNERTEAYQWVKFAESQFTLKPGEKVEVAYTVQVPDNAQVGGHYAVIFAETQPSASSANVVIKKRIGSVFYMNVGTDPIREGSVASWEANFRQKSAPLQSTLRLRNTGNTHYQADIKAQYSTLLGRKKLEVNQQTLILPGTTRKIGLNWDSPPSFGIFKVSGSVSYLGKTETLNTKYIILVPTAALVIFVISLILVIGIMFRKKIMKKVGRSKKLPKSR